jgi:hypothetical protein
VVEPNSEAFVELSNSDMFTFLMSSKKIYDGFRDNLEHISKWESLKIEDPSLSEGTEPTMYYTYDDQGQIKVISSIKIKWTL